MFGKKVTLFGKNTNFINSLLGGKYSTKSHQNKGPWMSQMLNGNKKVPTDHFQYSVHSIKSILKTEFDTSCTNTFGKTHNFTEITRNCWLVQRTGFSQLKNPNLDWNRIRFMRSMIILIISIWRVIHHHDLILKTYKKGAANDRQSHL